MQNYRIHARRISPEGKSELNLLIRAESISKAIKDFMDRDNIVAYFDAGDSFSFSITPMGFKIGEGFEEQNEISPN